MKRLLAIVCVLMAVGIIGVDIVVNKSLSLMNGIFGIVFIAVAMVLEAKGELVTLSRAARPFVPGASKVITGKTSVDEFSSSQINFLKEEYEKKKIEKEGH